MSAGQKTMSTLQTCDVPALTVVSGITYEVDRVGHRHGLAGHFADGIAVGVGDGVPSGIGLGGDIFPRAVIGGGGSDLLAGIRPRQRGTRGVARLGVRAQFP